MFAKTSRILVIDDMNTMRQLVKAQLKAMGFSTFYEGENGAVGFDVLIKQLAAKEPIDLVLSDWNMPVLSGLDLLKKVRAMPEFKTLPFMLVTAEGEQHQVVDAIKSGVSNYLVKPFTPQAIQEKIAAVYKKHFPNGG